LSAICTESDLVAIGISVAEQYRLRYEGKLPTQMSGNTYVYPAHTLQQLAGGVQGFRPPASATPGTQFRAEERAQLERGWRAAVSAERRAGAKPFTAVVRASRKHPALAKALCGVPLK
jgi:hypothetical protein